MSPTSPGGRPGLAVPDVTLTERLFQGLARDPDAPALIDGASGRALTGRALMDGVRRLAGGLAARGHAPGVVAIMAPNLPEYALVFHGAAWAGGAVTTMNPTYTAAEARHQLVESGATLLVTVPAVLDVAREAARGTAVREIAVIGDAPEGSAATPLAALMGEPMADPAPVDRAEHVVALPFSSGTTGLSKGVMLTHRNLVANVAQVHAVAPIEPGERTIAILPFFHIYALTVLMNAFVAAGGVVVTLPRFDLEAFLRLIQEHRPRKVFLAPPVVLALAKDPRVASYDLSSLDWVASGAAPLGAEVAAACAERIGAPVLGAYGMTEASPLTHLEDRARPAPGSVGRAVPGLRCRVVDPATGEDRPAGETGEVWVSGPNVMKGYLNRPDATAATLTADGWLRTGDLGRLDAEGNLHVLDRLKELIKVSGFQVAPAEVEAALLDDPAVADAAVVGEPDEETGEAPVAYVALAPGATADPDAILERLRGRLATYKRPREIRLVDAIPKSASGKILRRLLRPAASR